MTKRELKKNWKKAISLMSREELHFIIEHPSGHYPDYLEMVEARMEELSSNPEDEALYSLVKKNLEALGCPCEYNEDGSLDFFFQGSRFYVDVLENSHFIQIHEYCWKEVRLDDINQVERLKKAVNYSNSICNVTTYYAIEEEGNRISVASQRSILYRSMATSLKEYLRVILSNFFSAHDQVYAQMVLLAEKEKSSITELDIDKLPFTNPG